MRYRSKSGAVPIVLAVFLVAGTSAAASPQKAPDVGVNTDSAPGGGSVHYPQVAASGSLVHVVWLDGRRGRSDPYYNGSADGGATWREPDLRLDAGATPGLTWSYNIKVAASGNAVYVTWVESQQYVMFDRSLDGGVTWLPLARCLNPASPPGQTRIGREEAMVAVDGGSVHVTWTELTTTIGYPDVYFTTSTDGGTTWSPQIRLNVGVPAASSLPLAARIAASGGTVAVVWREDRQFPLGDQQSIYCNCSTDGGRTWLPTDVRLNLGVPANAGTAGDPAVACAGATVHVAWSDGRNGRPDIYYDRSSDGGATWLPSEVRLDVGSPPGATGSGSPQIAATPAAVLVCWQDSRNGNSDLYLNRSLDGGSTWLPTDTRLDTGSPPGVDMSLQPQLAAAGQMAAVVWADTRHSTLPSTAKDIYLNRSLDAGTTWLSSDLRIDLGSPPGVGISSNPQVAMSGSSIYVVWREIATSTDIDARFNLASGYQPYGAGTAGFAGVVPTLTGAGAAAIGGVIQCEVRLGVGGAPGLLIVGFGPSAQVSLPLAGGKLLVSPTASLFVALSGPAGAKGAGSVSIPLPVPANPVLLGLNVDLQGLFLDPQAVLGVSMTPGLAVWIG